MSACVWREGCTGAGRSQAALACGDLDLQRWLWLEPARGQHVPSSMRVSGLSPGGSVPPDVARLLSSHLRLWPAGARGRADVPALRRGLPPTPAVLTFGGGQGGTLVARNEAARSRACHGNRPRLQAALSLRPSVLGAESQSHLKRPWRRAGREPSSHGRTHTRTHAHMQTRYKATPGQNWEIPTQGSPFPGALVATCLSLLSAFPTSLPACSSLPTEFCLTPAFVSCCPAARVCLWFSSCDLGPQPLPSTASLLLSVLPRGQLLSLSSLS